MSNAYYLGSMTLGSVTLAYNRLLSYSKLQWRGYQISQHHVQIAQHLEAVERGEITRLIIEAPPRHGKSLLVSENFPAWYLGRNPDREIIASTYSQNLANKFGRKVRNQLLSPVFQSVFPNCRLTTDSKSKHQFNTTAGGEYNAIGVGGPATGKGANLAILDDTLKGREQAESQVYRESLKDFFKSTIYTRLTPDGAIVIMQTRWHEDDLIGYVLSEHADENWVRLTLPAVDDNNQALWPDRFSHQKLMKIKKVLGPYDWNALYLQRPSAKEGNILKRQWWRYYSVLPPKFDEVIQSWDMNFKEGKNNSFVVGQVWGRKQSNIYLIDQFRGQIDFTQTIRELIRLTGLYPKAHAKLVEAKANGPAILSILKDKVSGLISVEPEGSKESRVHAISSVIESGNVFLPDPKIVSWVEEFIDECSNFPNGAYDDQVDAMSQALSHLASGSSYISKLEEFLKM